MLGGKKGGKKKEKPPIIMPSLGRILSRPTAKPYRTRHLDTEEKPYLNAQGQVDFAPGDVENPHNWSTARRWYCTCTAGMLN